MIVRDVLEGELYRMDGIGYLTPNEYAEITWIIEREYMTVIVNGQVRAYLNDSPYIQKLRENPALFMKYYVRLHMAFGATVTAQNLTIFELE